ncbi:sensor histidine kinase [Acinetobacter seifertii]|uniref:sensor histidine kinase n=1 Tax=Acinetobacter seifertii TaxID=1530123 RepID=UPI00124C3B51|nr:HAMP domain-containing sensor histidine kinase [Acinetobacter seifertii]
MINQELLNILENGLSSEKLVTIANISNLVSRDDLVNLRRLSENEDDIFVKNAINRIISKISSPEDNEVEIINTELNNNDFNKKVKSEAIEWVSGTIIHELSKYVAQIQLEAENEIMDYYNSKTKNKIDKFIEVFDAISDLKKATNLNNFINFDLHEYILNFIEQEYSGFSDNINLIGSKPFNVNSSKGLITLVFKNGLKNAIEAVSFKNIEDQRISIVWGRNNSEYWLSIIDNGYGLSDKSKSQLFTIGTTTKESHIGFGLAIAEQAIQTLDGKIELNNSDKGGAEFKMSWRSI